MNVFSLSLNQDWINVHSIDCISLINLVWQEWNVLIGICVSRCMMSPDNQLPRRICHLIYMHWMCMFCDCVCVFCCYARTSCSADALYQATMMLFNGAHQLARVTLCYWIKMCCYIIKECITSTWMRYIYLNMKFQTISLVTISWKLVLNNRNTKEQRISLEAPTISAIQKKLEHQRNSIENLKKLNSIKLLTLAQFKKKITNDRQ